MAFPQILDNEEHIQILVNKAYSKFKKDFIENDTKFNGIRVNVDFKKLDCSNCGNNCNNEFKCDECPYIDKEDIFQHITSFKDAELRLTKDYKRQVPLKKRNLRTPGILNRDRLRRIPWISFIIENYDKYGIMHVFENDKNNKKKKKLKIYDSKSDFLVILSVTKLTDRNIEIYLNSAYHNPPKSFLKNFIMKKRHPVGVSTAPDTD